MLAYRVGWFMVSKCSGEGREVGGKLGRLYGVEMAGESGDVAIVVCGFS